MVLQDGSLVGKGADVRAILSSELGIPDGITRSRNWVSEIMSLLNELQWTPTLTVRTGIGQPVHIAYRVGHHDMEICGDIRVFSLYVRDNTKRKTKIGDVMAIHQINVQPRDSTCIDQFLDIIPDLQDIAIRYGWRIDYNRVHNELLRTAMSGETNGLDL